jgi:hypothetical protein
MIEIEVTDFQSIQHTSVLVDGFTAIVGRSNIGKSAIVRAIQFALTNTTGTDFVRHGAICDRIARGTKKCKCFSRVRIKTSAIEITWEKGDNVNRYIVLQGGSSQVYEGLDRGTPPFLTDTFQPVKVGESKELVQIPDQFEPIFLLNRSGTVVADVLSDVAQLDEINVAMAMAVKDRKDSLATRKVRAQDIEALGKSLEAYAGLDSATKATYGLQVRASSVKDKQDEVAKLDRYITSAKTLGQSVTDLKAATANELPDQDLQGLARSHASVDRFFARLSDIAPKIRGLSGVSDVALPDDAELRDSHRKLSEMGAWLNRLQGLRTSLDGWKEWDSLPVAVDPAPIRAHFHKLSELDTLIAKVLNIEASFRATKKDLEAVLQTEASIVKELGSLGMCPACTQPIDANHTLHLEAS